MQCPFCGSGMEKGFILGRKDFGLPWYPDGAKVSAFLTKEHMRKVNGMILGERSFPENAKLELHICRTCGKGIAVL